MDDPCPADPGANNKHVPTRDVFAVDDGRPIDELITWLPAQVAIGDARAAQSTENVLDYYEQKCHEAAINPGSSGLPCRMRTVSATATTRP